VSSISNGKINGQTFQNHSNQKSNRRGIPLLFKQVFLSSRCNIAQHALGLETDQRILLMEIAAVLMGVMMNLPGTEKKTSGKKSPQNPLRIRYHHTRTILGFFEF